MGCLLGRGSGAFLVENIMTVLLLRSLTVFAKRLHDLFVFAEISGAICEKGIHKSFEAGERFLHELESIFR